MPMVTNIFEVLVWICLAVQVYHYVGYIAVLWILAHLRPRPIPRGDDRPKVSLIIAAHNEESVLAEKIHNSLALDYPDLEVLIVEDGSVDGTAEVARQYADRGVILLSFPNRLGKANAIAKGVDQASGEILVFSDANAMYRPDAIRQLVSTLTGSDAIGLVSGAKTIQKQATTSTVGEGEGLYWRYEDRIKRLESAVASTTAVVGEMIAMRKAHFAGFPADLINDDAYLAMYALNQGRCVVYEPKAVCSEAPSSGIADDAKRRVRMTAGRYQIFFTYGMLPWKRPLELFMTVSHKLLRLILGAFIVTGLATNVIAVLLPGSSALMTVLLGLQIAFYGLAAIGARLETMNIRFQPARLAWYVTSGHVSSLLGFFRYRRGLQTALWEKPVRQPLPGGVSRN